MIAPQREVIAIGFFSDLNKKLTEPIYAHGSPPIRVPICPRRVEEMVDLCMPFIRPEASEDVRLQILGIIHEPIYDEPEIGRHSAAEERAFLRRVQYVGSGIATPALDRPELIQDMEHSGSS